MVWTVPHALVHTAALVRAVAITALQRERCGAPQGYEASKNDQPIQPSVGVFNELALQRCDLLLAEAAKNNIRLILALSNWWDEQARALARPMRQFLPQPLQCRRVLTAAGSAATFAPLLC